ncbi:hypothetical protein Q5P01_016710 [Channa striata]|uniref:Uncharacterized protein n=1 Tax=Channa striata TaxID=64152 RepID=A0AA88SCT4_CHASR|nr:hypothetical protein Q5P01_016710 [Channa striata]
MISTRYKNQEVFKIEIELEAGDDDERNPQETGQDSKLGAGVDGRSPLERRQDAELVVGDDKRSPLEDELETYVGSGDSTS